MDKARRARAGPKFMGRSGASCVFSDLTALVRLGKRLVSNALQPLRPILQSMPQTNNFPPTPPAALDPEIDRFEFPSHPDRDAAMDHGASDSGGHPGPDHLRCQFNEDLELPDLVEGDIDDELDDTNPGFSFVSDLHNKCHHHKLLHTQGEVMMDNAKSNDYFYGGIVQDSSSIEAWLHTCPVSVGHLFVLAYCARGQPARGTERLTVFYTEPQCRNLSRLTSSRPLN